jgi:hypothetical protein
MIFMGADRAFTVENYDIRDGCCRGASREADFPMANQTITELHPAVAKGRGRQ